MTSVTYYGHVPMTYMYYIDTSTGKTLVCQPGQVYNIAPASGNIHSVGTSMPGDGRFSVNGDEAAEKTPPASKKARASGQKENV